MSGETFLPDMTREAEVAEARAEYDRALSEAALATWARRYGAACLDTLELWNGGDFDDVELPL